MSRRIVKILIAIVFAALQTQAFSIRSRRITFGLPSCVNGLKKSGVSLLHEAAKENQVDVIEALVEGGVLVNERDICTETALHRATAYGQTDAVKALIKHGAAVNLTETFGGNTPLSWAARWGGRNVARTLLENKANVNATNNYKESALLWSAVHGLTEVTKVLIEYGADVNTRNWEGTAVQWAIRIGSVDVLRVLLDHGATSTDFDGLIQYAAKSGREDCYDELLRRHPVENATLYVHNKVSYVRNTPENEYAQRWRSGKSDWEMIYGTTLPNDGPKDNSVEIQNCFDSLLDREAYVTLMISNELFVDSSN